jgi:hypothetical protein
MGFNLSIDPPPAVDGGGPDYFGYRWRDSNDASPAFAWVDCSGTNVADGEQVRGWIAVGLQLPLLSTTSRRSAWERTGG